jgi:hypothetical protein
LKLSLVEHDQFGFGFDNGSCAEYDPPRDPVTGQDSDTVAKLTEAVPSGAVKRTRHAEGTDGSARNVHGGTN